MSKKQREEPEIYDYDTSNAGVLSDAQLERIERQPIEVYRPEMPMRRGEYVPGRTTPDLPQWMTQQAGPDSEDGAFNVATAQALSAGAGGIFEHTSAADRARADLWRAMGYGGALLIILVGFLLFIFTSGGWHTLGGILAGFGGVTLFAMMGVHAVSMRHSQAGVARYKITTVRDIHRDRLNSRERLAHEQMHLWFGVLDRQYRHELDMERERNHARKR